MVEVAKYILPKPPRPPLATVRLASSLKSAMLSPVWASLINVPIGTCKVRSLPDFPSHCQPDPASSSSALNVLRPRKWTKVFNPVVASKMTSPPRPPLPPSGPPLGINFARLKLVQPFPPCPSVKWFRGKANQLLLPFQLNFHHRLYLHSMHNS